MKVLALEEHTTDQRVLLSKRGHCQKGTTCENWHAPEDMKLSRHQQVASTVTSVSTVVQSKLVTIEARIWLRL